MARWLRFARQWLEVHERSIMIDAKVQALLNDLQFTNALTCDLAQSARKIVFAAVTGASEKVMYGGIVFADRVPFWGFFRYTTRPSVEFGRGCELFDGKDPHHGLEGNGKFRRHLKLTACNELNTKHLREYVV
jgi:hypothetical protein